jgi:uncharacterized protein YkwD
MRAFVYIVLIGLVLWTGFAWESAQAPPLVVQVEAPTSTSSSSQTSVADEEEVATEARTVLEPGPLVGSQAALPVAPPEPEPVEYNEAYVTELELAIHELINIERELEGLKSLKYDDVLAEVAAYHSTDMAQEDYFAHQDEDGCDSACRVTSSSYKWRMVGENLFLLGSGRHFTIKEASTIIVVGWMNSEGHRANVLQPKFSHEGVGVVINGDSIYATEVLALPR